MTTQTFGIEGMTCEHCVHAVSTEFEALPGVSDVTVDLVVGGVSSVTVASAEPLDDAAVLEAVDEAGAGEYRLASTGSSSAGS